MSESSKYHPFTAADIERYHNGQMPPAERHALEKAALEDPFLADALEGYAFTATPTADVQVLKERLEEKLNRRKSTPFLSFSHRWMQIAALFLVLAGSGWMVYHFGLLNKKEIATVASPKKTIVPYSIQPLTDSASTYAATTPNAEQKETEASPNNIHKTDVNPSSKPKKQARATTSEHHPTESNDIASILNTENDNVQRKSARSLTQATDSNREHFSMARSAKRSVASANISKPAAAVADSNTALAGRVAGVKTLPDTVHLNAVLQDSNVEMNEVVVSGYTKKKQAPPQYVKYGELEPAQGWANFDTYIAESLKEPEEVKEKKLSGNVQLSFDVNKEGEAVNIKVEKSLCSKCDEEAIRLLKEGPKWKKKKNKKGRVTIQFLPL